MCRDLLVAPRNEDEAIPEGSQPRAGLGESVGVGVDADDPDRRGGGEERLGMPAEPDRRVDEDPPALRTEERRDLAEKDRNVHRLPPSSEQVA